MRSLAFAVFWYSNTESSHGISKNSKTLFTSEVKLITRFSYLISFLSRILFFEIKYRVVEPQSGTGNFIAEAESPQKIWEHTAPWIKGFGVKVEIRVMMTDEEFLETAKN